MAEKKGGHSWSFVVVFSAMFVFFPRTERDKIFEPFFSGPEAVALQWSPSLGTLTGEIQPTAFHTLRGICHKPTYLHAHLHTRINPETDEQTLFKCIHGNILKYAYSININARTHPWVQTHNICHISVKATQTNSILESISILPLFANLTVQTKQTKCSCCPISSSPLNCQICRLAVSAKSSLYNIHGAYSWMLLVLFLLTDSWTGDKQHTHIDAVQKWIKKLHRFRNHISTIVHHWEQTLSWSLRVSTFIVFATLFTIFVIFHMWFCSSLPGLRCRGRKASYGALLYSYWVA